MAKNKKKKRKEQKQVPRNYIIAVLSKEDPARLRDRTVLPEKGKGHKDRPRDKQSWKKELDSYSCAA